MIYKVGLLKKMSAGQKKAGNQITLSHSHSLTVSLSRTLVLLNNFCFHVYAQKSLPHYLILSMSHSHTLPLSLSHLLTLHMLNNFCFHVYAVKFVKLCRHVELSDNQIVQPQPTHG